MIFVPKKIRVGYQNRSDTYTKKLAYVIYYDEKNKLRKEGSWNSWRDKGIDPDDYENEPIEGFVLNKKVGGENWGHFNFRQTYVRVYDPRGFEFEITVPNLLYILENTSSTKGKGLEGRFVYGWSGTELILIPESAPEYTEYLKKQEVMFENKYLKPSELIIGHEYLTSDNKTFVYMGKYTEWERDTGWYSESFPEIEYVRDIGRRFDQYYRDKTPAKVRIIPKGLMYFFYNQEGKLSLFKKTNKTFYKDCYNQNSPRYLEFLEKLNKDSTYSPIDLSKTFVRDATFEEFEEHNFEQKEKYWPRTDFHSYEEYTRKNYELRLNKKTEDYNLRVSSYRYNSYKYSAYGELENISLKEAYEIIKPKIAIYYLENGNEWERSFI